jgi:pheromone receptor transcription factor
VYTFATPKLQPLITKPEGKNLIQACLNAPEPSDLLHAATGHPSLGQVPPPSMAPSSVPSSLQQSRSNSVSQLAVLDGNGLPHYPPCGNPAASNNALNNGSASSSTGMAYASSGGYIDPYAHHHQHLPHLAHMQPSEPGDEDDLSPRQ